RVRQELLRDLAILRLGRPARARAGDRPQRDLLALDTHEDLGRGADDRQRAETQEEEIRRGIDRPERTVHGEGVRAEPAVEPPCEDDLVGVARRDVLLGAGARAGRASLASVMPMRTAAPSYARSRDAGSRLSTTAFAMTSRR